MMSTLAEVDWSTVEPLSLNIKLNERIAWPERAFLPTFSIDIDEATTERLAQALELAVTKIAGTVMRPHQVGLYFGAPPVYAVPAGGGFESYLADLAQGPVASAGTDRIYLDARRLAAMPTEPVDLAALAILATLVHTWLNLRRDDIAREVTARLYGGLVAIDGAYMTTEQAALHVDPIGVLAPEHRFRMRPPFPFASADSAPE
jgi:hypothetical protein